MFVLRGRTPWARNREAKKHAATIGALGGEISARVAALTSTRDDTTVDLFVTFEGRRSAAQVVKLYDASDEELLFVRLRPSAPDEEVELTRYFGDDHAAIGAAKVVEGFARTSLPIALVAEDGVDVERIAAMIHAASERHDGGFLTLEVGALDASALVRTLEKAAITARGGTALLTHIDRLSSGAQEALVEALESPALAELRFIVSSSEDPRLLARRGVVVPALAKILSVALVEVPPLRERGELSALIERLLGGVPIAPEALSKLAAYSYPENDRELDRILRETLDEDRGGRIELEHLPERVKRPSQPADKTVGKRTAAERLALEEALKSAGGNLSRAAKILGVARATLYRLMKKHAIMPPS